jgi:hypothetical protein
MSERILSNSGSGCAKEGDIMEWGFNIVRVRPQAFVVLHRESLEECEWAATGNTCPCCGIAMPELHDACCPLAAALGRETAKWDGGKRMIEREKVIPPENSPPA